ncbi:MAG: CDP-alcohol phosphatidyltransferase family protein [Lachnospiraceae bacterium]|nr:CDP-alcohol phosphatidyltransferase family protein [Lachnospiraceae bacterium]
MIGVYDYTVVLTYISLASSIIGMFLAMNMKIGLAVGCLALSGFLDMFDGKVARTKKDRTELEKNFGIQIDSLCDVICFGVLPVIICYQMGMRSLIGIAVLVMYCLCGMIRLGYFNVVEEMRQKETSENRKYYQGLPITSISVLFPVMMLLIYFFPRAAMSIAHIFMFGTGLLFVTDFQFRKPTNRELAVLVGAVAAVVYILFRKHGA